MPDPWIVATIMFGLLAVFLFLGLPVAFVLGGLSVFFCLWVWGVDGLYIIATTAFGETTSFILLAVPLFVLMANALGESGIANDIFIVAHKWLGSLRGGLGMATIVASGVLAAMVGVSSASTATMGMIAIPAMKERKYHKELAAGAVAAGGALGVLIPPSALMIIVAIMADLSVGQLFAGGMLPGIILSLLFMGWIGIDCLLHPEHGPAVPEVERATWEEKFQLLSRLGFPVVIIAGVLGSIYSGVATPTEAGALGALLCLIATAIRKNLTYATMQNILLKTLKISCMILWITIGAVSFTHILQASGVSAWILQVATSAEVSRWAIFGGMMVSILILGCFIDPIGIVFITTPIFFPLITALGFDPLWYAIIFVINMESAYLTPPFGFNLFVIRGVAPDISMMELYRGIIPFVICQLIGITLFILLPAITLWLPSILRG